MSPPLPDKLFFKIGEVAKLVGVRPHVLRYWESEFTALKPMKTRGAHRVYRRQDVELTLLIRRLLQDEGYTVPGAKRRLRELGMGRSPKEGDVSSSRELDLRTTLIALRSELTQLLDALEDIMRDDSPVLGDLPAHAHRDMAAVTMQASHARRDPKKVP